MRCATHETCGLPLRQQVLRWQEATDHYFGPLEAHAFCDGPFDARLTACNVGSLRLLTIEAPAHRVERHRPSGDPRHDSLKLLLQVRGASEIRQRDASIHLRPGDWSLYDPQIPYAITSNQAIRQLAVQIPREKLGHLLPGCLRASEADPTEVAALRQLLSSFLSALAVQLPALPEAVGAPLSETTLALLSQALLAQRGESPERAQLHQVVRMRVRQFIHDHLADADLTVERIAREMRCSKRYLHAVFHGEPHTLDRQIWRSRLERCRQALESADASTVSISSLAYRWGFNSNSHFCRLFKREFNATPSEFLNRRMH